MAKLLALNRGERKYRIKKQSLSELEKATLTQFERHLIQEGIKQVLFAAGTDETYDRTNEFSYREVPKELIRFLLDYDIIEEYKF